MSWVAVAIGAVSLTTGLINKGKAKKKARELERTRPNYETSELVGEDLDLGESELASGGLSSRAERAYNNLNDKQFSSSLDAILKGGGSVNNVAEIFGANDEGRQRLALLSDQMRLGQIDRLSRARANMAGEQEKAFEFNQWMPWADSAQATAASRQQAQNDIWSGITTAGGGLMQASAMTSNKKRYDDYFNDGTVGGNRGRPATARTTYYDDKPSQDYSDFQTQWPQ